MTVTAHLEELRKKHQTLSDQVEHLQRAPSSSDHDIAQLKKEKLKLKEEIERLAT